MIPYSCQDIDESDVESVVEVLRSPMLTQGPAIPAFEQAVAKRVGVEHGVAVSSATAALHLGCLALGVGCGDRVWTSPITFVASANCARYCGAQVDFVDVDSRSGNMSVDALEEKCRKAEKNGTLPKVVIPVHLAGNSCDMRAMAKLGRKFGFRLLEDASHALGAEHGGRPVGSCEFSDAAVFSFHAVKMITTGEGGMLMTRKKELADRVSLLRTHGITRDSDRLKNSGEGGWYYEMQELGFHYRMTDFQAGLGRNQLDRLDTFLYRRRALAEQYRAKLAGLPLGVLDVPKENLPSWHLFPILLDQPERRARIFDQLREQGFAVNVHYIPVTRQPFYRRLGFDPGKYPNAQDFYERELSIPLQTRMSDGDQDRIVAELHSFF